MSSHGPTKMKIHKSPDEKVLNISGVILGSVSSMIGPPKMELHWDSAKMKTTLNKILLQLDELDVLKTPIQRENLIDGFWHTLTRDLYVDSEKMKSDVSPPTTIHL
jgi:hypothetical protein